MKRRRGTCIARKCVLGSVLNHLLCSVGNHEAAEGALADAEATADMAGQALRFGPFGGPSARGQLPHLMRAAVGVAQAQQVCRRMGLSGKSEQL